MKYYPNNASEACFWIWIIAKEDLISPFCLLIIALCGCTCDLQSCVMAVAKIGNYRSKQHRWWTFTCITLMQLKLVLRTSKFSQHASEHASECASVNSLPLVWIHYILDQVNIWIKDYKARGRAVVSCTVLLVTHSHLVVKTIQLNI